MKQLATCTSLNPFWIALALSGPAATIADSRGTKLAPAKISELPREFTCSIIAHSPRRTVQVQCLPLAGLAREAHGVAAAEVLPGVQQQPHGPDFAGPAEDPADGLLLIHCGRN